MEAIEALRSAGAAMQYQILSLAAAKHTACLLTTAALILTSGCDEQSGPSDEYLEMKDAKKHLSALVAEMGGSSEYKFFNVAGQNGYAWVIDLKASRFTPEQFDKFIEVLTATNDLVAGINLSGSAITDDHLIRYDAAMHGRTLMDLNLSGTAITDKAMEKMDNLNCLNNIDLTDTKVTKPAVDDMLARRRNNPNTFPLFKNPTVKM